MAVDLGKITSNLLDFYDLKEEGDLLMFDYCLHEIPGPFFVRFGGNCNQYTPDML